MMTRGVAALEARSWKLETRKSLIQLPASSFQHRSGGFTFVELLIAATMTSVMFVGVGTHLRGGLSVWRRATETVETMRREHVALDRLSRDLANAVVYDPRPQAYGEEVGKLPPPAFEAEQLRCFTVAAASRERLPSLRVVSYYCEPDGGQAGLWRSSQALGEARARLDPARERLLPACERLSFRYGVLPSAAATDPPPPLEWRDAWTDAERRLPRLVEVSIRQPSGRRLRRVIRIPSGAPVPK
jgi:type II secretory pathway pseudopilin PulG